MSVNTKTAKVIDKRTENKPYNGWWHSETTGYCSECGAQVSSSQYGFDQDCPWCDAVLDWDAEEGKDDGI